MNVISKAFRQFYLQDIRPLLNERREELLDICIGPGWAKINIYEKTGRLVWGLLDMVMWIALYSFCVVMFLAVSWNIISGLRWLAHLLY